MSEKIEYKIAEYVKQKGGNTYYVGGFVRDLLQGNTSKDIDIEVHGISEDDLLEILAKVGKPLSYGKQFGIYSLEGYNIDIALPRTEINIGKGHKDFDVSIDPFMDLNTAIKRRDFTINAIYKDVLTSQIIDPYNGQQDIKNKTIRHIDKNKFIEDPLRVLRACQFASRFNYEIDNETIDLCKSIDITTLPKQRIEEELKKALLKSDKPSLFFTNLVKMNQLDYWFKDVNINYIDEAKQNISNINNKYEYLLSTLTVNSNFDISKIVDANDIKSYVNNIKENINKETKDDYEINKLFYSLIDVNDFIYLKILINKQNEFLFNKYESYKQLISKPCVMGKDLIDLGYKPGQYYNLALEYANDLRLRGIDKKEALDLTIKYIETKKLDL